MRSLVKLGFVAGLIALAFDVCADGLRNPPAGATGIGRIGGNKAHIDDPSAVYINPSQ